MVNDIKISGSFKTQDAEHGDMNVSGVYKAMGTCKARNVRCSGTIKVLSHMEAEDMTISGICKVEDSLQANDISCSGILKATKGFKLNKIKVSGICKTDGDISAKVIKCSGVMKGQNTISAESIRVSGCIKACDIESEDIKLTGEFNISNMLNANTITIEVEDRKTRSFCKNIGGENVSIENKSLHKIIVDNIEANDISIENTKCKSVNGNNIIIGKGCEIDIIEYKDSIEIHDKAKVKEVKKLI